MATIKFSQAEVVRLFRLENSQAVEDLIRAKVLTISAYTRRGQPLFDAEAIQRAAEHVIARQP